MSRFEHARTTLFEPRIQKLARGIDCQRDVLRSRFQVRVERSSSGPLKTTELDGVAVGERRRLAPDGQSFLVNRLIADQASTPITVILNWTAAFRN